MREIIKLNEDWFFIQEDRKEYASSSHDGWQAVTLPHTWNAADADRDDTDYFRGACWYQKSLSVKENMRGKRVFLEVLAASNIADVYLNGKHLGTHEAGFSIFRYDLTEHLQENQENTLAIRVDNSDIEYVYPRAADFTFFGGLYRGVQLVVVEDSHFDLMDYGSCGIYVTPKVNQNEGTIHICAKVVNDEGCSVEYRIKDKEGNVCATLSEKANVSVSMSLEQPHLWNGVEDPYLYTLESLLKKQDKTIDCVEVPFGFRTIEMYPDKGLFLNGKHVYLRGVSRHQCHAGCGWALGEKEQVEDIEIMEDMGVNSIRLAHYQHNPYFYDLCDQKGMLIWAEIPFITKMSSDKKGHENCRLQLEELIKQNYNHPSIFCWGISNEITIGGEYEELYENLVDLNRFAKELDTSRYTTTASVSMLGMESKFNRITDILAYNHYFGWYGSDMAHMEKWLQEFHEKQPDICLGISEYGAEGILQYHSDQPKRGDYTEEYHALYHRKTLEIFERTPWLWGSYVWNMFDFSSKIRDEGGRKGMNNKGLVTYDRKIKKDAFFVYKAHWSKDPFVHIASRRYVNRINDQVCIEVFSNAEKVTLYVNDQEVQTVQGKYHFVFQGVALCEGKNTIKATSDHGQVDEIVLCKGNEVDPSYEFEGAKDNVANWFDETRASLQIKEGYYSIADKMKDLLGNEETKAILSDKMPKIVNHPMLNMIGESPLEMLLGMLNFGLKPEDVVETNEALSKIKK